MTPLTVTYRRVDELQPHPRNPRLHTDKAIRHLGAAVQRFGWTAPIHTEPVTDLHATIARHVGSQFPRLGAVRQGIRPQFFYVQQHALPPFSSI